MTINYIEMKNAIFDEAHMRERTSGIDLTPAKKEWKIDSILMPKFPGNLEAGNINNEGLAITQFAIKRRSVGDIKNITLDYVPYDPDSVVEYTDYTQPVGNLIYSIIPVGENGLEGKPNEVTVKSEFTGWWIVDKNVQSAFGFDKMFEGEDRKVSVGLEQGRVELEVLGSKFPRIYYTETEYARFMLSAVIVPANYSIAEWNALVSLITQHIPLIVKSGNGDLYVCDIYEPSKQVLLNKYKNGDPFVLSVNCVEVQEYLDFMEV
jgi:hypothetical protein